MNKDYAKKLLIIAWPLFVSNIISQIQIMIDKMFLGRLDIRNVSAIGNVTSPVWLTMNIVFTLALGTTILASQAIGAGEKERGYQLTCSLFKYSSVISTVLALIWFIFPRQIFTAMGVSPEVLKMCITYTRIYAPVFFTVGIGSAIASMLQTAQKTNLLVYYGVIRSAINIVLDYIMIFGKLGCPAMGIKGAALATTIAEFVGEFIVLYLVIKDKEIEIKPTIKDIFAAKLEPYIESVKMGLPSAGEDIAWNLGNMMLIVVLNHVSEIAAGVYNIVFSVELVPVCAFGAMAAATVTMAGRKTGEGEPEKIIGVVRTAYILCCIMSGTMLILFLTIPKVIIGWFTTDSFVLSMAPIYLIIIGIDIFPKSANMIYGSGIKGFGDTKWMMCTQLIGTIFIIVASRIAVYGFGGGIAACFAVVVADETIRSTMNILKLRKISKSVEIVNE